ncbi:MAG TPA: ATP-binding cassette domain-containing protein [Acetobacteraceae bacterium]|jgi:branched-chain amino acid transport system ATP-binding protein/neutral amino acid transport system ATP-binding protein
MSALHADRLVAGYGAAEQILKGASVRVEPGEIVSIIGPNGAGKSTLLKALAGLLRTASGRITLGGRDVTAANAMGRARAGISFVPQERNVFGRLSVAENLAISGFLDPAATSARVEEMFARYPMLAEKRRAAARTLSGGQRQILAMAMGLMANPLLISVPSPAGW